MFHLFIFSLCTLPLASLYSNFFIQGYKQFNLSIDFHMIQPTFSSWQCLNKEFPCIARSAFMLCACYIYPVQHVCNIYRSCLARDSWCATNRDAWSMNADKLDEMLTNQDSHLTQVKIIYNQKIPLNMIPTPNSTFFPSSFPSHITDLCPFISECHFQITYINLL